MPKACLKWRTQRTFRRLVQVFLDTQASSQLLTQSGGIDVDRQSLVGKEFKVCSELEHSSLGRGAAGLGCGSRDKSATTVGQQEQGRIPGDCLGDRADGHGRFKIMT
jgi:hypothetical protein